MAEKDIALMAHLMRRAGFGATREELEAFCAKGYEATVEELIHPENQPVWEQDLEERYYAEYRDTTDPLTSGTKWVYRMCSTPRVLEEKVALFWHGVLCTGDAKVFHGGQMQTTIDMFRLHGMGSFRDILIELSRDPGMVYFLDNSESHKDAPNENYGRELLELFSLGVGMDDKPNYSEEDVKECSRAFTGWTRGNPLPRWPYGRYPWTTKYDASDHDDGVKTFLGETGNWNGEDIINIIVKQPSCARFIARHLYNFFVADDVEVAQWQGTAPRDPEAIRILEKAFVENNYEIRAVLRALFNADFFKNARFAKIKSPAEVVVGTMRLVQDYTTPKHGMHPIASETRYMGQDMMDPPTVEGWHTGKEWIDSGTLVERINFVGEQVGNTDLPGVKAIINRLIDSGVSDSKGLVEGCLDLMGPMEVSEDTLGLLTDHASKAGELRSTTEEERADFSNRVGEMMQLIVATQEFQLC